MAEQWQAALVAQENVWVVWPPHSDRLYRLEQLAPQLPYRICSISLQQERLEDAKSWENIVERSTQTQDSPILFVIRDAELLFPERAELLLAMEQEYIQRKNHSFLFLSERYPYTSVPNSLRHTVLIQPPYSDADRRQFLEYVQAKFSIHLTPVEQDGILDQAGTFLWLIKHLCRLRRQMSLADALVHESWNWRVDHILASFTFEELHVLRNMVLEQPSSDVQSASVLQQLGIVTDGTITSRALYGAVIQQVTQ